MLFFNHKTSEILSLIVSGSVPISEMDAISGAPTVSSIQGLPLLKYVRLRKSSSSTGKGEFFLSLVVVLNARPITWKFIRYVFRPHPILVNPNPSCHDVADNALYQSQPPRLREREARTDLPKRSSIRGLVSTSTSKSLSSPQRLCIQFYKSCGLNAVFCVAGMFPGFMSRRRCECTKVCRHV